MAFTMKKGGKEVGPASVYAPAHTMDGKAMPAQGSEVFPPNMSDPANMDMTLNGFRNKRPEPVKTSGVKIRGTGAATKGVMARGPMA
jgi:hypothetical protein